MDINYFVGIDGGGSKTKLVCYDLGGKAVASASAGGTYYRQDGVDAVIKELRDALTEVLAGLPVGEACVCFGMPGYGENIGQDEQAAAKIAKAFEPMPICFENDVAAGWAGALALGSGVNIVGGTGSMSYGRDPSGRAARGGGWSEYFSDEGSGYWLGKMALSLFAKQSDLRLPRGPLYDIVRRHFSLKHDFDIIGIVESEYAPSRKKTASLQMLLLEAARSGDESALGMYAWAAEELALIALACIRQLEFSGCVDVSYVGGLFNLEDLILRPMGEAINRGADAALKKPLLTPCEGAALFAAQAFAPERLDGFRNSLLDKRD